MDRLIPTLTYPSTVIDATERFRNPRPSNVVPFPKGGCALTDTINAMFGGSYVGPRAQEAGEGPDAA